MTFGNGCSQSGSVLYDSEVALFRQDFDAVDDDKDGCITYHEIQTMLEKQLGQTPHPAQVQQILSEFDIDQDGKVTFQEYMGVICGPNWTADDPAPHAKDRLRFMVAVDGSDIAMKAFRHAITQMRVRGDDKVQNDKLIVYHATNPFRYSMENSRFNPDTLMETFKAEVTSRKLDDRFEIEYLVQAKEGEQDKISKKVRDYADEHADVLALGSYGIKRELGQKTDQMGSTTKLVTTGCKAITIVLDGQTVELPECSRRYLVGVDGSDLSHCAAEETLRWMRKGDFIQMVHVDTAGSELNAARIVEKYTAWLVENKIKGACQSITKTDEVSIADVILGMAGTTHCVVVGSNGLSKSLPPRNSEAYWDYRMAKRETNSRGSVAECILQNDNKTSAVYCITVDSMLSGAVKSQDFNHWYA